MGLGDRQKGSLIGKADLTHGCMRVQIPSLLLAIYIALEEERK